MSHLIETQISLQSRSHGTMFIKAKGRNAPGLICEYLQPIAQPVQGRVAYVRNSWFALMQDQLTYEYECTVVGETATLAYIAEVLKSEKMQQNLSRLTWPGFIQLADYEIVLKFHSYDEPAILASFCHRVATPRERHAEVVNVGEIRSLDAHTFGEDTPTFAFNARILTESRYIQQQLIDDLSDWARYYGYGLRMAIFRLDDQYNPADETIVIQEAIMEIQVPPVALELISFERKDGHDADDEPDQDLPIAA